MKLTKQDLSDFRTLYNYLNIQDKLPERADAAVVGGAWLRTDAAERAAELYHKCVTKLIIFSGYAGFQPNPTGQSEAEIMAQRALELGVPASAILLEERASNTAENIKFAAQILADKGIKPKNIVLVHKPYMTRRFKATAEAQWSRPQPKFYVTSVADDFDQYLERERRGGFLERTLWSMPGDYQRIAEYARKGWQTEQPVSKTAEAAFRRLQKKFAVR